MFHKDKDDDEYDDNEDELIVIARAIIIFAEYFWLLYTGNNVGHLCFNKDLPG